MYIDDNFNEKLNEFVFLLEKLNKEMLTQLESFVIGANNFDLRFKYYLKLICLYEDNEEMLLNLIINHEYIENIQENFKSNLNLFSSNIFNMSDVCNLLEKDRKYIDKFIGKIDVQYNFSNVYSSNDLFLLNNSFLIENYNNSLTFLDNSITNYYLKIGELLNVLFKVDCCDLCEVNGFIDSNSVCNQELIVKTEDQYLFNEAELIAKLEDFANNIIKDFATITLLKQIIADYFSYCKFKASNSLEDGTFSLIRKI